MKKYKFIGTEEQLKQYGFKGYYTQRVNPDITYQRPSVVFNDSIDINLFDRKIRYLSLPDMFFDKKDIQDLIDAGLVEVVQE